MGWAPATEAPSGPRRRSRRRRLAPRVLLRAHLAGFLARLPAFSGCTPRELRRVAEWGDLIDVAPGQVLAREDRRDFWFFVVVTGRVRMSVRGTSVGVMGPGGHFGEGAIVGLRPQPATATVVEPALLFVLGARYFLSVVGTSVAFQKALFPDVAPSDYPAFVKRMLEEGRAEWARLPGPARPRPGSGRSPPRRRSSAVREPDAGVLASGVPTSGSLPPELDDAITSPERIPGSPLSLREAVAVLAHLPPASSPVEGAAPAPVAPRWLKVAGACSAATLAAAGLFVYHPPRAVITAGTPIDVSADVEVAGAPGPPRTAGRFELLWVEVDRPSLAGYLVALARGGATAPADSVTDPAAAERAGRADYLDSQKAAAAAGARLVGVDPVRVHVTFRDRGLTGPSAGLVYALVVAEDLSGRDLTGGRVVAATGTISPDGSVGAVGWVAVKALGATGIGASLLLVPADEVAQAHAYQGRLFGVDSLDEALQDLVGSRTIATCSPGPCSSGWTSRRPRIGR